MRETIKNYYFYAVEVIFATYLTGILMFGRAFAIVKISTPMLPIYVTEIILFVSLPLILLNGQILRSLPKTFSIPLLVFFLHGCFHLLVGIYGMNIFAIRDLVLCGYILFFPLTLAIALKPGRLKLFLIILIAANCVGILVTRWITFNRLTDAFTHSFLRGAKWSNFGIYFGLAISFSMAGYSFVRSSAIRIAMLIVTSINLYMLILFAMRTLWVAVGALFIVMLFILRIRLLKFFLGLIPIFLLCFFSLYYLDFKVPLDSNNTWRAQSVYMSELRELIELKIKVVPIVMESVYGKVQLPGDQLRGKLNGKTPDPVVGKVLPEAEVGGVLGNVSFRRNIWRQAIDFGMKAPLWGRGFGVYPIFKAFPASNYVPPTHVGANSNIMPAHNHLVTLFYKMGFSGLLLFLYINTYLFFKGLTHLRRCTSVLNLICLLGCLGGFVFWHVSALFYDIIDSPPTSVVLWILAGIMWGIIYSDKNSQESKLTVSSAVH